MRGDPPSSESPFHFPFSSTPHARGSTLQKTLARYCRAVYPACAGIHPIEWAQQPRQMCLPRMRGDPPYTKGLHATVNRSTPHARGSTLGRSLQFGRERVYPACAGIHLDLACPRSTHGRLPRMRGDPPPATIPAIKRASSTPHARGSTGSTTCMSGRHSVYPACAGIHPFPSQCSYHSRSLPRMRGDPPKQGAEGQTAHRSTPHARGSTRSILSRRGYKQVYPACAGIHHVQLVQRSVRRCLPRMRGDPPWSKSCSCRWLLSTPHARGSTLGAPPDP